MIFPKKIINTLSIEQHYDELDEIYRKIWGNHLHHGLWKTGNETSGEAVENLVEFVEKHAQFAAGMKVCDVGCGYGETERSLLKKYDLDITALTISPVQYEYAKENFGKLKSPNFILCDFLKNTIPSAQFDVVIAIESTEHMVDKKLFFQEAYRILKPNGKIVTCAWLAKENPRPWEIRFLLEPICREGQLPSLGSDKEYQALMKEAGFANISSIPLAHQVKKTWGICIKRVLQNLLCDYEFLKKVYRLSAPNRAFLKSLLRIWLAYQTGSLEYNLLVAEKST